MVRSAKSKRVRKGAGLSVLEWLRAGKTLLPEDLYAEIALLVIEKVDEVPRRRVNEHHDEVYELPRKKKVRVAGRTSNHDANTTKPRIGPKSVGSGEAPDPDAALVDVELHFLRLHPGAESGQVVRYTAEHRPRHKRSSMYSALNTALAKGIVRRQGKGKHARYFAEPQDLGEGDATTPRKEGNK